MSLEDAVTNRVPFLVEQINPANREEVINRSLYNYKE
jgi:hypothetical protein